MAEDTPTPAPEHRKRDILDAIDFELALLSEESRRTGLTIWALVGAGVAIVWFLLRDNALEGMTREAVYRLLPSYIAIMAFVRAEILADRSRESDGRFGWRLVRSGDRHHRGSLGLFLLVSLVSIACAWLALSPVARLPNYPKFALAIPYIMCALSLVIYRILLWFDVPLVNRKLSAKERTGWLVLLWLPLLYGAVLTINLAHKTEPRATAADYRITFACAALVIILIMLAKTRSAASGNAALCKLRRMLALGYINAESAAIDLDRELLGTKIGHYFGPHFESIDTAIRAVRERIAQKVSQVESAIKLCEKSMPDDIQNSAQQLAEGLFDNGFNDIEERMNDVTRVADAIARRRSMLQAAGIPREDIVAEMPDVRSDIRSLGEDVAHLRERHNHLGGLIGQG